MGLFSFVGKALKGVAKIGLGVARGAASIATHGASEKVLSAVGLAKGGLSGKLPSKKRLLATIGDLNSRLNSTLAEYKSSTPEVLKMGAPPTSVLSAVSTPFNTPSRASMPGAKSPVSISHRSYSRTTSRKRSSRRRTTTRKASSSRKRKLKFGSPAWRAKYLGKRRKSSKSKRR